MKHARSKVSVREPRAQTLSSVASTECRQLSGPEELSRKTQAGRWRGTLSGSPDLWHHPTPPSEVEHSFPPASGKVSSQQFSSGSLSEDCPWPKRAGLPKVMCPSEGQPLSNAWLMLGHKAWPLSPTLGRLWRASPAQPQSSLAGSARLCCSCIRSRRPLLPDIPSSGPSPLCTPRVLLDLVPAAELHLSLLPGEPVCTKWSLTFLRSRNSMNKSLEARILRP